MFRRNILPPSAGWKSKPRKKLAEAGSEQWRIPNGYRGLLLPEDGGDIFLRNVGLYNQNTVTWGSVERRMVRRWGGKRSWPILRYYFGFVWRFLTKNEPRQECQSTWPEPQHVTEIKQWRADECSTKEEIREQNDINEKGQKKERGTTRWSGGRTVPCFRPLSRRSCQSGHSGARPPLLCIIHGFLDKTDVTRRQATESGGHRTPCQLYFTHNSFWVNWRIFIKSAMNIMAPDLIPRFVLMSHHPR